MVVVRCFGTAGHSHHGDLLAYPYSAQLVTDMDVLPVLTAFNPAQCETTDHRVIHTHITHTHMHTHMHTHTHQVTDLDLLPLTLESAYDTIPCGKV